tara:strand:- start:249 stop:497 length:249 start_codon:yes stop_codon:yes gene_type:complete
MESQNKPVVSENTKKIKIIKNRCKECKKKLGGLGFTCKCSLMFCSSHLTPEYHNCTYDFKTEQCKRLEKSLIKVVAPKVPVI